MCPGLVRPRGLAALCLDCACGSPGGSGPRTGLCGADSAGMFTSLLSGLWGLSRGRGSPSLSKHLWPGGGIPNLLSPQEETPKGEGAEQEPSAAEGDDDGRRHGFLILSREDSTMILQTGQEIMELDTSGFATQGPTVFAGNIGDSRYIVQVSPLGIRLLEGGGQGWPS